MFLWVFFLYLCDLILLLFWITESCLHLNRQILAGNFSLVPVHCYAQVVLFRLTFYWYSFTTKHGSPFLEDEGVYIKIAETGLQWFCVR